METKKPALGWELSVVEIISGGCKIHIIINIKLGPVVLMEIHDGPLISKVRQCLNIVWILQCNKQLSFVVEENL